MYSSITIVIPNFNGIHLLKRHLPSVVAHSVGAQIIVVDDASTDTSLSWLSKKYPNVKIIQNQKNLGFAATVNRGFKAATGNLVLLLNNDVSINQHTIEKLKLHFSNKQVFAVGALEKLPRGKRRGKSQGRFARGLLIHSKANKLNSGPTLWTFAASGMFNKSIWLGLGGLDTLYKPAYYEDIDIGYRAWKAGFVCLFEPGATVEHDAEATMNKTFGAKKTMYVFKNQLLFFWKNVTDLDLILLHLLWTPYHLIITTIKTRGAFLAGFILALLQLDQVSAQESKFPNRFADKEVIKMISKTD